MDDTQQSRVSDAAAAATRKRRSSILKSQRPTRTPFSELEFNVATPTDTAKSRRVSFSRRTGVAEFVTNEATTTWKNFYEEHNKSLESSSNDSEANPSRQPVGHLGKRIFDQQFEEVEAFDFISGLANSSLNNVNFSQQLASLECTGEGKLTAPHNKFELSAFTEQSKLFGNDFTTPSIGENSGRIDFNFSAIHKVEKDDLDEIEMDLERGSNNMGHGPYSDGQNMSEYIEIDLNMTHVVKDNEDMTITDTVRSPVQDVSKSASIDKKVSLNNDWVADKENIAVNPYAAPCESNFADNEEPDQVLVFDGKRLTLQPDIPEKDKNYRQTLLPDSSAETPQRKTIVLNVNDDLPNFIDDMLNSKCEHSGFNGFPEMKTDEDDISDTVPDIRPKRKTIHDNTGNISMTQALPTNIMCQSAVGHDVNATTRRTIVFNESTSKNTMTGTVPGKLLSRSGTMPEYHRTLVYEDNTGNISITQAVPSNILVNKDLGTSIKHKTIVFDSDEENISVTQAISSNIFEEASRRKTIVYDVDGGNVSFTQALPANIMLPDKQTQDKRKTIIYENDTADISVTQALPANIMLPDKQTQDKRKTIIYENKTGDISITQALPANIMLPDKQIQEKRKTIIWENDTGDISVTQALPANIMLPDKQTQEKRKTIIYENDTADISVTQALPANIMLPDKQTQEKQKTIIYENDTGDISVTLALPANIMLPDKQIQEKRKTIIWENDTGDISVTQALPANIMLPDKQTQDKRKTIIYENDTADISVTQALPANIMLPDKQTQEKRQTIIYENDTADISVTQALPADIMLPDKHTQEKRKTIIYENDTGDIYVTQALPANIILPDKHTQEKRKTIIYENDTGDISVTQALPANIMLSDKLTQEKRKIVIYENNTGDISVTQAIPTNVILPNNEPNPERRRTVVYEDETGDISVTQALPSNILLERVQLDDNKENNITDKIPTQSLPSNNTAKDGDASRRRTIVYENETGNISITQAIPTQLIPGFSEDKLFDPFNTSRKPRNRKRTTIVYDNDEGDISMTEAIPANIIEDSSNGRKTVIYDEDEAKISTTLAISTNVFLLDKLESAEECITKPEDIKEDKEEVIDYKLYEEDAQNPTGDGLQYDQKSIVFNADDFNSNMSITMAIPKVQSLRETEKRKTVIFDNDNCDISMTKPIFAEFITSGSELLHKARNKIFDDTEPDQGANPLSDVIVLQASTTNSKPSLHSSTVQHGDLKTTIEIYSNMTSDSKEASSVNVVEGVIRSPEEDVSASASLLHPRLEHKLNQLNLMSSSSDTDVDKDSEGEDDALVQTDREEKNASLPSLLTMSTTSVDSGMEDKNCMARIESNPSSNNFKQDTDGNTSNESMFYITKDSDYDTQTDREADRKGKRAKPEEQTYNQSPTLQLEYKEEEPVQIDDLQMQSQCAMSVKNDYSNRMFEDVVSSDLDEAVEKNENDIKEGHNFKKANDTQELLDMITNFTNSRNSYDDAEPAAVKPSDESKHKRLSFATKRQSIPLSREDFLNNISMAQAALQKSRLALDDSECPEEDTKDASLDISKKSGRTSSEVVKTLQFDDESISETSLKFDTKYSPLKKTAFGETSYMNETKGKVIPSYLKDVSDGIKELMLDLVKPVNDNLPFESVANKGLTKVPSTQSTQIQANLVTSSQVDLDCELLSNTDINPDADNGSSLSAALNKSRSRALRSPVRFSGISSGIPSEFDVPDSKQRYSPSLTPVEPAPPEVLVFDHLNPLNNILLAPINHSGVHRYNPKKSYETLDDDERLNKSSRDNHKEMETVTTAQFHISTQTKVMQEDVAVYQKQDDQFSIQSSRPSSRQSSSRPISIDQSIDASSTQRKNDQVNTMIAMKGNKELLETSSSLTLVDDALDGEGRVSPDHEYENHRIQFSRSNLVDIEEQAAEIDQKSPESALSERIDHLNSLVKRTKGKKRIYSPSTDKYKQYQPSIEITPKPITKMQKISNSPNPKKVTVFSKVRSEVVKQPSMSKDESTHNMSPEKDSETSERRSEQNAHTSKVREKKSPKAKETKQGQTITVQQLLTDYHNLDSDVKHIPEKQLLEDLNLNPKSESSTALSQSDVSFTSSKNLNVMKDVNSTSTTECQSSAKKQDWHPELMCATSSNLCSSDSGVNVVAKIDMLHFMGSHECEWETSSTDTWSFRLLHGRLRLTARLAHRHDNATRTRVRGDTPVLDIAVETVQHDRKNPVAAMTVRYACETMRYMVSRALRSTCYASDIPPLLRRCAAVARVALRWGRAMHDAKLHLAYTVDNDGNLSLKVANIPLRSVWEITMRIELVLDDTRGVPWPRAGGVRVARVVSDVLVPDADVRRVLEHTPCDWGHAPRTIWRMFRYLKHKTRDNELLLA